MSDDTHWLDGNARRRPAGRALRRPRSTGALRTCAVVRRRAPRSARTAPTAAPGIVLRCPACSDVALLVTALPDRLVVELRGSWAVQLPRAGQAPR